MVTMLGGGCLAVVALAVIAFFVSEARGKRRAVEALAARGRELGTWTVYYDVKQHRIGLVAAFGEGELVRYLLFRLHDLFDYHQGSEPERRRIADLVTAAARKLQGETWSFVFNPPKEELFHSSDSPKATLFKYFEGMLYEQAIDQPRFMGGDFFAKQEGLVGECIALIQHLIQDPQRGGIIAEAVVRIAEKELREGRPGEGARFWNLPNETLREIRN